MSSFSLGNSNSYSRQSSALDPRASQFRPISTPRMDFSHSSAAAAAQKDAQSLLSELSTRVLQLEQGQEHMQSEIMELRSACPGLCQSVNQDKEEDGFLVTNVSLTNDSSETSKLAGNSLTELKSVPPHLRTQTNGSAHALVTDGKVDPVPMVIRPAPELTPPPISPTTTFAPDVPRQSVEDPYVARSAQGWMPSAVLRFPKLAVEELSIIPSFNDTKSFSLQFLEDTFGGKDWSPGLRIMPPGTGICILPTRSYYLLNADFEPYLPREPGHHGAKLTAFFNEHPATIYGEEANISLDNVPLFVCSTPWAQGNNRRYIYFGNYSQTRWSDKLDYDRMQEYVPLHVKEFWAEELSAQGKDEWVRKALMKHFFPMPEYEGTTFYGQPEGSGANGEEEKVKEKVYRDVKEHVKVLKDWEKDAMLKTRLIKKDFIMKAFERADADEPPALRLWWEYLQCVKYDRKFYDLLVQLQSRKPEYLK